MIATTNPNSISKSFCLLPWTQIAISPVGVVKPCCIFNGAIRHSDGTALRISDESLDLIWNGKHFREIRKKMLAGEPIKECVKCTEEEQCYSSSDRINSCFLNPEALIQIDNSKKNDGRVSAFPSRLDLKLGNTCNLRCRMCQPIDSGRIDAEFSKISKEFPLFRNFDNASAFDYYYNDEPIEELSSWVESHQAQENIKSLLVHTKQLALAGGEIAISKTAVGLLKYCMKSGAASKISLTLSSNLTKISDDFIKILACFRQTRVIASIDGVGNLFEYIRYPAKWDRVRKNLQKLIQAPANVIPIISPTIQNYNILNVTDIFDLMEANRNKKWETIPPNHLVILFFPEFLNIRYLPRRIKDIAHDRIVYFCNRSYYFQINPHFRQQINLLLQTLRHDDYKVDVEKMSHFLQYSALLDRYRKQNMKDSAGELFRLLKEENIVPRYPNGIGGNSFSFFKYRNAGHLYQKKGEAAKAVLMFRKAIELKQDDAESWFSLGNLLKHEDQLEAKRCFRNVYESNPKHYHNLLELAFIEKCDGKIQAAINLFKQAKANEPLDNLGLADKYIQECIETKTP